ncbi:hypothetical protein EIP91_001986 [Steccherinum ochraceum]|uniref:Uncharacterized protein n=1 Tax=Steccherinum ochraceum TaxID=92696 RepID=A0A4R0RFF7_9APHY|nr:hypothetical protein EIP91_001986 [Steccherinum ochraceum]
MPGVHDGHPEHLIFDDDDDFMAGGRDEDGDAPPLELGGAFFDEDLGVEGGVNGPEDENGAGAEGAAPDEKEEEDEVEVDQVDFRQHRLLEPEPDPRLQHDGPAPCNSDDKDADDVFVVPFPSQRAGETKENVTLTFGAYATDGGPVHGEGNIYAPFASRWDLVIGKWAKLRGFTTTALNELLSEDGLSKDLLWSYKTSRKLNRLVNQLSANRARFRCKQIMVADEVFDAYRDVLKSVKALMSEPTFAADMIYAPERHYVG